jgi:excisionase family DNA binding protein
LWTKPAEDMQKQIRQLITPKEQARRLSCSLRHLQNMKNGRIVPHLKLGRLVRYDPEAVDRALERLTVKAIE